jgi:hypothetical protein
LQTFCRRISFTNQKFWLKSAVRFSCRSRCCKDMPYLLACGGATCDHKRLLCAKKEPKHHDFDRFAFLSCFLPSVHTLPQNLAKNAHSGHQTWFKKTCQI